MQDDPYSRPFLLSDVLSGPGSCCAHLISGIRFSMQAGAVLRLHFDSMLFPGIGLQNAAMPVFY